MSLGGFVLLLFLASDMPREGAGGGLEQTFHGGSMSSGVAVGRLVSWLWNIGLRFEARLDVDIVGRLRDALSTLAGDDSETNLDLSAVGLLWC